jgi:Na+-translocating ferredoxin:NAD+ oxidoreductase subunit D
MNRVNRMMIGSAPHIHASQSTASMVFCVIACLLPQAVFGVWAFGPRAAAVMALCVATAALAETACTWKRRPFAVTDGTAVLTGLIVAFTMPPAVPLYIPVAASAFATFVAKWTFGGTGSNWINPALSGMAFARLSWPAAFEQWILPNTVTGIDGVSGASPIRLANAGMALATGTSPMDAAVSAGFKPTEFANGIADFANGTLYGFLNVRIPPGYFDLLFGNKSGTIGEGCAALLLLGGVILMAAKVVRTEIPVAFISTFLILEYAFGALPSQGSLFGGDMLFSLLSGSVILTAFFLAPDPVTSPIGFTARVAYGMLIGLLSFLFRTFGLCQDGSGFAVLMANCVSSSLDEAVTALKRRGSAVAA